MIASTAGGTGFYDALKYFNTVTIASAATTRVSVFQRSMKRWERQLLPDRNAYENVAFALHATGTSESEVKSRVTKALGRVGLTNKRHNYPHELSGGEQQRVVIARAIANDPWVLLADEPTGNLDPAVADEIHELLLDLHRQGMTLFMATHDHRLVKSYPARTLALMNGQVVEIDPETL